MLHLRAKAVLMLEALRGPLEFRIAHGSLDYGWLAIKKEWACNRLRDRPRRILEQHEHKALFEVYINCSSIPRTSGSKFRFS